MEPLGSGSSRTPWGGFAPGGQQGTACERLRLATKFGAHTDSLAGAGEHRPQHLRGGRIPSLMMTMMRRQDKDRPPRERPSPLLFEGQAACVCSERERNTRQAGPQISPCSALPSGSGDTPPTPALLGVRVASPVCISIGNGGLEPARSPTFAPVPWIKALGSCASFVLDSNMFHPLNPVSPLFPQHKKGTQTSRASFNRDKP